MLAIVLSLASTASSAQEKSDTVITNVDADLINIFNQKTPKKYKISAIKVTGNSFFDENLLISIANVNVGDEVVIPGGDLFSKAITKLWGQNYFSDVEIFITKLEDKNIEIEIAVTERARLSNFLFKGVSKSDAEDLTQCVTCSDSQAHIKVNEFLSWEPAWVCHQFQFMQLNFSMNTMFRLQSVSEPAADYLKRQRLAMSSLR